ncbi:MAG TPA: hypothetical protein VM935_01955, partial [Chitinophagaceae bacterium]|nr:hypothetical protein [Chitinophagaceae bacterium]
MKAHFFKALSILFVILSSCTSKQDKKVDTTKLLGTGFGISGATLVVKDLDSTRNYYSKVLGFTMPLPEKFQKGTYEGTLSASVSFPDWSSFELLSVKDTGLVAAKHSFITSFLKHHE